MIKMNNYLKLFLAALIMTVITLLYDLLFSSVNNLNFYMILTVSHLLIASVLFVYIMHSRLNGIYLILSVFLVYYLIGNFNILIEALIFNITNLPETLLQFLRGLILLLLFSLLLTRFFVGQTKKESAGYGQRSIFYWTSRIILADILYVIIYMIAGLILNKVYPQLMQFYQGKLPDMKLLFLTQFFRGFVFIAIAILILQTVTIPQVKKAILIGLIFSILGGIAPLLPPNSHMPGYVRLGHGFEVGISNFVYGFLIAMVLKRKHSAQLKDI